MHWATADSMSYEIEYEKLLKQYSNEDVDKIEKFVQWARKNRFINNSKGVDEKLDGLFQDLRERRNEQKEGEQS